MQILSASKHCPESLIDDVVHASCLADVFNIERLFTCHSQCHVSLASQKNGEACGYVVIKSYVRQKLGRFGKQQVENEIRIHSSVHHNHTVKLLLACEDERHMHLLMELADGGDLRKHLPIFNEEQLRDVLLIPLLHALDSLHQKGIVHRDIKPDNVLVHEGVARLADFGLAVGGSSPTAPCTCDKPRIAVEWSGNAACSGMQEMTLDQVAAGLDREAAQFACQCCMLARDAELVEHAGGTPLYTAPEVLLAMFRNEGMQSVVTHKNDVWALGVLALEAVSGRHPFGDAQHPHGNIMFDIAYHSKPTLPSHISQELADLLSLALQRDPSLRPTAGQLLQHPWVQTGSSAVGSNMCAIGSTTAPAGLPASSCYGAAHDGTDVLCTVATTAPPAGALTVGSKEAAATRSKASVVAAFPSVCKPPAAIHQQESLCT